MSNPPSPLAALTVLAYNLAPFPAYIGRRLAAGEVLRAREALQALAVAAEELLDELEQLEPWEFVEQPPLPDGAPPADPAKDPYWRGCSSQAHLGRGQGPSVDATPDTGYADQPLF